MLARMNTMLAMISCSPPRRPGAPWPCQGKAGERIQMSRGMQAMRLIVMELGRFMDGFRLVSALECAVPTLAFCHSEAVASSQLSVVGCQAGGCGRVS